MTETRCALYARVSSEAQTCDNTIASQVIGLQERIAADGFVLDPGNSTSMTVTAVRPASPSAGAAEGFSCQWQRASLRPCSRSARPPHAQQALLCRGTPRTGARWGIVGLSRKYPTQLVEQACADAVSTYARLYEQALQHGEEARQPALQLPQDHPLNRDPAEYGDIFSHAVRHDAGNKGRQAEAHDDRRPCNPRSSRLRNPDQLRRRERSRCAFSP